MKVSERIHSFINDGKTFFSFEYFPPKTDEGVENLFDRMDRMVALGPAFCDITWGAGGSTADVTLDIAEKMQNAVCVETMMHLTCTNMPVEKLKDALTKLKSVGIQNILALRGDPPKGQETFTTVEGGFSCALDLIRYVRKEFGDFFGIGIAGYPEAHPDVIVDDPDQMEKNYWSDIQYLKQKVDAGGEFIITQLFYDCDLFLKFVADCRSVGITVPILPGIMPIMSYGGFNRMTGFCKVKVPKEINSTLEGIKDNDEAVKAYGVELGYKMCKKLLEAGTPGLHMYSLNMEKSAVGILQRLGLVDAERLPRTLPWRPPANASRAAESVRPIFWSNRPKAYLARTKDWDQFPQGRWGNAASPGYGTLNDYPFMRRHTSSEKRREAALKAWGSPSSLVDVQEVFSRFCRGEIALLPWSEVQGTAPETRTIKDNLLRLISQGLLSINSQPCINGTSSSDPQHGWGGAGGFVYQKAYIEFFCSPESFRQLITKLESLPSLTYLAVNAAGDFHSNQDAEDVNAVTWGVFPGKEVVQPTVVDSHSFLIWKDEAFELWMSEWGSLYDAGSVSRELLSEIQKTWFLVSVVDNNYVSGNLFDALSH